MPKKKKKKKPKKPRNWLAIWAWFRKAGAMKDRKKEANRKKCRKPINED
jgi:hypothetical protein